MMVFSSSIFLLLFLPLFLTVYYLTPDRFKNAVILLGSYAFYGWWRIDFLALFILVTVWNWIFGILIHKFQVEGRSARKLLIVAIAGDLSTLGYFKYANFGIESFNAIFGWSNTEPLSLATIILPIGISFYTFQAISYVVDVYRGDVKPTRYFIDFAAFIALFPQLIAGPVLRYKDLADQFRSRAHAMDKFNEGAYRFMLGFCKKVLIADTIAPIADACFNSSDPGLLESWLGILAYTAQLYFDFSGYSDMAIGLGLMMGFRFIENFRQPYCSQSITEFWRRWHISLSTWLRDYLYIPLGGNRGSTFQTYRNLFLTMLLGGLWHGANWTFVVWGAWHGIILGIERRFGLATANSDGLKLSRLLLTLLLVMLGWVVFRAENIATAFTVYAGMAGLNGLGSLQLFNNTSSLAFTLLGLAWLVILWRALGERMLKGLPIGTLALGNQGVICLLFSAGVMKLMADSYSPFLYFQF